MKLELGGLDDVDVSAMLANVGAHVMAEAATAAPIEARRTGSDAGNTSELSGPSENGSGVESEAQSEATRMTEELPAAKADEPQPAEPSLVRLRSAASAARKWVRAYCLAYAGGSTTARGACEPAEGCCPLPREAPARWPRQRGVWRC